MTDRPSPRFHRDNGSDRINALRRDFEHWYVGAAFDYTANPIGSQNCDLQWRAWLAASDAASPEGAQPFGWVVEIGAPGDLDTVDFTQNARTAVRYRERGHAVYTVYTTPPQPQDAARDRDYAERYRWLRDEANEAQSSAPMVMANPLDRSAQRLIHGEELDAAIDAARGAGGGG